MNALEELVILSKFGGRRLDWVQAGGGNTSVKLDNRLMRIKASGCALAEVTVEKGHTLVDYPAVIEMLRQNDSLNPKGGRLPDEAMIRMLEQALVDSTARPSIETFLHAVLGKYCLRIHPVAVNAIVCRPDWQEILESLYEHSLCIGYRTPGYELGVALKQGVDSYREAHHELPGMVFLQNHGLFISAETLEETLHLAEETIDHAERFLNMDLSHYKLSSRIADTVNGLDSQNQMIAWVSEDSYLSKMLLTNRHLFFSQPLYPDQMVYCGPCALELEAPDDVHVILAYRERYQEWPRVILCENRLFLLAQTVPKARAIEDVLKAHLIVLQHCGKKPQPLSISELAYLGNWEAEKYRRNL